MEKLEFENFENSQDVRRFLWLTTGHYYSFAVSSSGTWGDKIERNAGKLIFYQLMPDDIDGGFFDWYCEVRENYQFFKNREMCVVYFVFYYNHWIKVGSPKKYNEGE